TVQSSSYAVVAGIPIAILGLLMYVTMLGLVAVRLKRPDLYAATTMAAGAIALTGLLYSAYLTYVELFVIDAICQWCVVSAVLMTLSLGVAGTRAFAFTGRELGTPQIQSSHGRE